MSLVHQYNGTKLCEANERENDPKCNCIDHCNCFLSNLTKGIMYMAKSKLIIALHTKHTLEQQNHASRRDFTYTKD